MLKDGVVLTIIGVIVLGAIFVWWTETPTRSFSAAEANSTAGSAVTEPSAQKSEAALKTGPVVAKTTTIPKPTPAPVVEQAPAPAIEAAASRAIPVPAPPVHVDPPPFPAVEQIATGVRKDSITGKYGEPALAAVTLAGGHIVETFVYARRPSRSATIIRLEDGRVSAAYSRPEPVLPSGLSVPLPGPNQ
jgi:hypothetical protein